MKKIQKTNAMRFLDQHKVEYKAHTYEHKENDPEGRLSPVRHAGSGSHTG